MMARQEESSDGEATMNELKVHMGNTAKSAKDIQEIADIVY